MYSKDYPGSIHALLFMERSKMMEQAMDTDKDGKITKSEFMKYMSMMDEKKFAMMDLDNDGVITHWEFVTSDDFGAHNIRVYR